MTKDANEFKAGDYLSAADKDGRSCYGMRQMVVEDRSGVLYAVPVCKDGLEPMPLQEWMDWLIFGAVKIDPTKEMTND